MTRLIGLLFSRRIHPEETNRKKRKKEKNGYKIFFLVVVVKCYVEMIVEKKKNQ